MQDASRGGWRKRRPAPSLPRAFDRSLVGRDNDAEVNVGGEADAEARVGRSKDGHARVPPARLHHPLDSLPDLLVASLKLRRRYQRLRQRVQRGVECRRSRDLAWRKDDTGSVRGEGVRAHSRSGEGVGAGCRTVLRSVRQERERELGYFPYLAPPAESLFVPLRRYIRHHPAIAL